MVKIIVKTFIKTALAVVVMLAVAFGVVSIAFPQHMATLFENAGCYRTATDYASLRHFYTGNVNDLDRCARDSILSRNNGKIVKYCGKLVADEEFAELCTSYIGAYDSYDYRQYICGNLASAQYAEGDAEGAVDTATAALDGVEGFPVNNALALLCIRVAEREDGQTAKVLLAALGECSPVGETQTTYYQSVINILNIGD